MTGRVPFRASAVSPAQSGPEPPRPQPPRRDLDRSPGRVSPSVPDHFTRAEAVRRGRGRPAGRAEPDAGIREELARIERAILQGTVTVPEEFGGLQAAVKRSVALEKRMRRQPAPEPVRHAGTRQTVRLSGARFR